jgi:hypothetical protein
MARLFITPREIDYISDLTKEITKDVIGQAIYYYKVREDVSEVHDIYEEATEKIFDPPVEIECRVEWQQNEVKTDRFGYEETSNIQAYLHYRDMIDKGIKIEEGDYFSFGSSFFEITSTKYDKIIFGQVEHVSGITLIGKRARRGQIDNRKPHGPTEEKYTETGSVQEEFEQQRGFSKNSAGATNDVRDLQKRGVLEKPISSPKKVAKENGSSTFYGDDC